MSLKTSDIDAAKERAFDQDADVRFRLKHDVPIFNRPFSHVAKAWLDLQDVLKMVEGVATTQTAKHLLEICEFLLRADPPRLFERIANIVTRPPKGSCAAVDCGSCPRSAGGKLNAMSLLSEAVATLWSR